MIETTVVDDWLDKDLVNYLDRYAATGKEYVKILRKIISQNKLTDFDNAVLMNTKSDSTLTL